MVEFLTGMGIVCVYFIICATIAILCRHFLKIPDEVFRKLLHFILLGSVPFWIYSFSKWWMAVLGCILFIVIVYPILKLAERKKDYSKVVTERKRGELKHSLVDVFSIIAIVISVCWGIFRDKLLVLASIYAWGIGDAFAALIGKKIGKHKIYKKKSLEGSTAMYITSLITILTVLLIRGKMPVHASIITALITAFVVTIAELYTPDGHDTITCPLSAMATILPLVYIFGRLI